MFTSSAGGGVRHYPARLFAMRIDPELAVSLRRGEEAATELAGMRTPGSCRIPGSCAASEAAVTEPDLSEARDQLYTVILRIADSMTERFDRGEQPITCGNASLVELLAFVSTFGPAAIKRAKRLSQPRQFALVSALRVEC